MSNQRKVSSYRQKVKKVELALRRKGSSLEKQGVEVLGYTKWQVYAATRNPVPQHGTRYEIAVKLGILTEGEPT